MNPQNTNVTNTAVGGLNVPQPGSSIPQQSPSNVQGQVPTTPKPLGGLPMMPGVNMTPINPAQDLRSQSFSVGPTADRFQLAQDRLANWDAQTNPMFEADVRSVESSGASRGQLGSGPLKTRMGDLTLNRDIQRQAAQKDFLTDARDRSIEDIYRNLGIAQDERAYQAGAQQQAFSQGITLADIEDRLKNSQFGRDMALYDVSSRDADRLDGLRHIDRMTKGNMAGRMEEGLGNLIGSSMGANTSNESLERLRRELGI